MDQKEELKREAENHAFLGVREKSAEKYYATLSQRTQDDGALIFLDANILMDLDRPLPNGRPAFELLMAQAEKMNAKFVISDLIVQHELLGEVQDPSGKGETVKTHNYSSPYLKKFLSYFSTAEMNDDGTIETKESKHPKLMILKTPYGQRALQTIYEDSAELEAKLFRKKHFRNNYGEEDIEDTIKRLKGREDGVSLQPIYALSRDYYLYNAVNNGLSNADDFPIGVGDTRTLLHAMFAGGDDIELRMTYHDSLYENFYIDKQDVSMPGYETAEDYLEYFKEESQSYSNEKNPFLQENRRPLTTADSTAGLKPAIGFNDGEEKRLQLPVSLRTIFAGELSKYQKAVQEVRLGAGISGESAEILQDGKQEWSKQLEHRKETKFAMLDEKLEKILQQRPPVEEIILVDAKASQVFDTEIGGQSGLKYREVFKLFNKVPEVAFIHTDLNFDLSAYPEVKEKLRKVSSQLQKCEPKINFSVISDEIEKFHKPLDKEGIQLRKDLKAISRRTSYQWLQELTEQVYDHNLVHALLREESRAAKICLPRLHEEVHLIRTTPAAYFREYMREKAKREEVYDLTIDPSANQPPIRWLKKEGLDYYKGYSNGWDSEIKDEEKISFTQRLLSKIRSSQRAQEMIKRRIIRGVNNPDYSFPVLSPEDGDGPKIPPIRELITQPKSWQKEVEKRAADLEIDVHNFDGIKLERESFLDDLGGYNIVNSLEAENGDGILFPTIKQKLLKDEGEVVVGRVSLILNTLLKEDIISYKMLQFAKSHQEEVYAALTVGVKSAHEQSFIKGKLDDLLDSIDHAMQSEQESAPYESRLEWKHPYR